MRRSLEIAFQVHDKWVVDDRKYFLFTFDVIDLFQFNDGGGRRFARRVISGLEPSDRNILGNINSCLFRRFLVFFAADFFLKVRATLINYIMKHFKTKIF